VILELTLKYYRGDVFARWLREGLDGETELHGSYLADLLGTPYGGRPGLADNNYAADRLLTEAAAAKWIFKGRHFPGLSQAAFIGLEGRRDGTYTYPREWTWTVNMQSVEALAWARGEVR
jgi:hypothetical protein